MTDPNARAPEARGPIGELGGYQLLERVGAGALGEVFRARDTVHGRTVAIKRVPSGLVADQAWCSALHDKAASLAEVSHPGVAMLYECGQSDGQVFLAQEFVPGQTLTKLIAGRPINALHAVELAIEAADALAALHSAGHSHGDLRPDNIVVTPKGRVKLLDAGLARFTGGGAARLTAAARLGSLPNEVLPVLRYLAPEQALGEGGDRRSDLFSLGLVLYEMLTGQPAFDRTSADETLLAIVQASVQAPSTRQASVPAELDAIIARALAKPVDRRYQTAGQLADDLRAVKSVLDDELDEVSALVPEPASRLWWWIAGAAALGAALVAWILGNS
ncbi:MAG: serine/threonine protein kinase [Vicinamibacteria bacterium]|nr:serine/threonine protein kinase [Vicinamibacteria bacterium]